MPVFELAAELLAVLEDGPEDVRQPVIAPLVKAVDDTRRVEGHDLSGRLFHTLLTDAKFTGAYYTSVPAATLLARLVYSTIGPRGLTGATTNSRPPSTWPIWRAAPARCSWQ